MFERRPKTLYNPREVIQDNYTDFDTMRDKPMVFKSGSSYIVCMPVTWEEHYVFIKDLSRIMVKYYEVFQNAEFLTTKNYRDRSAVTKLIDSVTIYKNSKLYKQFSAKAVPEFIARYAWTVKRHKTKRGEQLEYARIKSKRQGLKLLREFPEVDILIQIFFTLIIFNYDSIKERTVDFMRTLGMMNTAAPQGTKDMPYSSSTDQNTSCKIPGYSEKPFGKQLLKQLEQMSGMPEKGRS